jgi:hypothetical protein
MHFTPELLSVIITMVGSVVAGLMRFASLETRINNLETMTGKLDRIAESVARIEGKLESHA